MKHTMITVTFLLTGMFSMAQQNGDAPAYFHSIASSSPIEIKLAQGEQQKVTIVAADEDKSKIEATVKDSVLSIYLNAALKKSEQAKVIVTVTQFKSLDVSGNSEVESDGVIQSDELSVKGSGTADIDLNIQVKKLWVEMTGAGDLLLIGNADKLKAKISGAGSLNGFGLETLMADVASSGAGDAKIFVKDEIKAMVSGAGSILYKGNPEVREIDINGAGSVRQTDGNISFSSSDTTRFKLKDKKLIIIDEKDSAAASKEKENKNIQHWAGIDVGMNFLDEESFGFVFGDHVPATVPGKSLTFDLNLFEKDFHLYKNYCNLVTGVGIGFSSYTLSENHYFASKQPYTFYVKDYYNDFRKNKLKTTWVNVPLLLEFNSSLNKKRAFHVGAGVLGSYLLASKYKFVIDDGGSINKMIIKDDFNINPFKFSATVRAGYGGFTAFANYGINSFFESNKGPDLRNLTVGISITGF